MEYIFDLEIHTKYARACSPDSDLEHNYEWALKKGIDVVGTGDFTHTEWFRELSRKLEPDGDSGLYFLSGSDRRARFLCSSEVSCIWRQGEKTRRVHIIIFAPSLEVVERINAGLKAAGGKLGSDGRPILGMSAERLCDIVFDVSDKCLVIPAHVWTPWFGMYGSKSGFDSLKECFGSFEPYIYAVETGLSSDPPMNWRLQELDSKSLVSFSDAHSSPNLGREATVFDLSELSYDSMYAAIAQKGDTNVIAYTIEFFPEEGMYHFDGHRACGIRYTPKETKQKKFICPKCKKTLTVGVMHRVEKIATREEGYKTKTRPEFRSIVPLPEVIGDALGVGKNSKTVAREYELLLKKGGSEFNIFFNVTNEELDEIAQPIIAEGIKRVKRGQLHVEPGYDGVYGVVKVFTDEEREQASKQATLF